MQSTGTMTTDWQRIKPLQDPTRDEGAWRAFIARYSPLVYRLAKKKGLDRDEAETIFQEFCMQMLRKLPKFEYDPSKGRFRDWVLTVSLNLIRHYWRTKAAEDKRRRRIFEQMQSAGEFEPTGAAEWWHAAENARRLQLALEALRGEISERDFDIFERLTMREEPVAAVADSHGLSANAVYGVKFRVLRRVREIAADILEQE